MSLHMHSHLPGLDSHICGDRELLSQERYEIAAEKASDALFKRLESIERKSQHLRDAAYIELIRELFTGSNYGRERLQSLLEDLAQDTNEKPTDLLIAWHRERVS